MKVNVVNVKMAFIMIQKIISVFHAKKMILIKMEFIIVFFIFFF
jgi:hypothetical protein